MFKKINRGVILPVLKCLAAGVLSVATAAPASGQTAQTRVTPASVVPQAPARDISQKAGTARIRGRVVAADTGRPLRKVQVRALAPELRETRLTSTDPDGKYELDKLPAGRYQLSVTKGSYVSLSYGQSRPFEPGKPLEILDGQTIEKVDFALPPGGVIAGRVFDEFGDPIADVRVTPMRSQYVDGRRRLNTAGRMAVTNDIGEYRIFGLGPGHYYLSASLQGASTLGGSDDRTGYAPTYYPGTPNAAEATRIKVGLGQALNDVNLTLVPTRTAGVSGVAIDSQGTPLAGGMVIAMQRSGNTIMASSIGQIRPNGSFSVANLSPGDYLIQAVPPGTDERAEFGSTRVTVAGEDVTGVQLAGMKLTTATGRLVVRPEDTKSLQPSTIRLMARDAHPEDNLLARTGTAKVNDDYTFELKTRPGQVLIRPANLPTGWGFEAVRHNGADITDLGIELRPSEEVSGIEVEVTNQLTEVSGSVTNRRSEPVKDYTVVLFARDRERWGSPSRYVQSGRPDQDGRFKVVGLPASDYYVIAVDYLESGEENDPEFLDRVKTGAVSLSLNDGEKRILDLKILSIG